MSLRYETTYIIKPGVNLGDPRTWNVRFQDVDLRLNALESIQPRIDSAIQEIIAIGIDRINSTFNPLIIEAQNKVAQLDSELELGIDGGTF